MFFVSFFMWLGRLRLAQASCTELTLRHQLVILKLIDLYEGISDDLDAEF